MLPPEELLEKVLKTGQKLADSGSILVGEKGILFSPNDYGAQFFILPGPRNWPRATARPKHLPVNNKGDQGMKDEWVEAIKAGKPEVAYSNFDIAGLLTEAFLLGNVAIRAGKKIEFDAAKVAITNDKAANHIIKREYRKGWELSDRA